MYSITPYSLASSALRLRLESTNSLAAVSFLPWERAFSWIRATMALVVLLSLTGSTWPRGERCTGWAEPMMQCGAMAATSEPISIRVPADQAAAPEG